MAEVIMLVLKASLFLTVLVVGLRATASEVFSLLRAPALLVRSLIALTVVMPIVAVVLAIALDLRPVVRLALGALSVSVVPPTWSARSTKTGGEQSYVVGLLFAASTLAILTVPLGIAIVQRLTGVAYVVPLDAIVRLAATTLLLPLVLGAAVRRLWPALAGRLARPVFIVAQLALVVGVIPILIRVWPTMIQLVGQRTLLAMVLFVLIGLAVGHTLAGGTRERRSVLALATAFRHPTIAIAIAHAVQPEQTLAPAAVLLYLLVCAICTFPYQRWIRARRAAAGPLEA